MKLYYNMKIFNLQYSFDIKYFFVCRILNNHQQMKRNDSIKQTPPFTFRRGNYYYIRNISQDLYLTVKKTKDYQNQKIIVTKLDKMELNQIWMIQEISQNKFQFIHPYSSFAIQRTDKKLRLKENKTKNSQIFWIQKCVENFDKNYENVFFIKEFRLSKKYVYLVQNELNCQQELMYPQDCNKWSFQIIKSHSLIQQTCIIQNCRSNMVLEVFGSSIQQQAKIVQNQLSKNFNQRWHFIKNNGEYMIKSLKSGLVLDVKGQRKKQGTNVIQYRNKNSQNQKWILQRHGKGVYIIRSMLDKSLMLGIKGNSLKQLSQLVVTKNQNQAFWRIVGNIQ